MSIINHTHFKQIHRGRASPSFVVACLLLVFTCIGLISNISPFPDTEDERQLENEKYLANLEGLSLNEYRIKDKQRTQFYRDKRSTKEAVLDAINLKQNSNLKALMADVVAASGDDYQWWPRVYSASIKADNMVAFRWFLKEKYPCNYANIHFGQSAFREAIVARKLEYFEHLLKSDCDTRPGKYQTRLDKQLKQLKLHEWVDILYSYQPWYQYE